MKEFSMLGMNIIIKNGKVLDGNSNPWFRADVGIKEKKIVKVGNLDGVIADRVINAKGMIVAPGFIDIHNHSEIPLLVSGRAESMVRQGVTTMLTCNCGSSPFPLLGEALENAKRKYSNQYDLEVDWSNMGDYEAKLKHQGISVNVCLQIGHSTLRAAVVGYEARAPTYKEMEEMKRLVTEAMVAGAFGLSTGLGYSPGMFADTKEIIELCKVVAKYRGIYSTHARWDPSPNEGFPKHLEEALEIGEKAGLPVEMSHIGSMTAGPYNWGRARSITLNIIDAARAKGIDFTADIYPYIAASTGLTAYIPQWAHEGGLSKLLERIAMPSIREKLKQEHVGRDWSQIFIVWLPSEKNKIYIGKTMQQVAQMRGVDPVDALCDFLIDEEGQGSDVNYFGIESDIRMLMKHETVMIGSDGSALEPIGVLGQGKNHPRNYGAFARVIETYVGDGVLSLSEAVHKMSGMPAWRLGLRDRGVIKPNHYADITIFDPFIVKEKGTWTDPYQFPEGISYVLVNGVVTIDDGEHTGAMAGEVIHKP
jgi:N-acyl-D-amino-acid deacylase